MPNARTPLKGEARKKLQAEKKAFIKTKAAELRKNPPPPEEVERRLSSNKGTRKWKLWFWAKREAKKAWHNLPQNKAKVVAGGDNEGEDKQQEAQEKAQEEAQEEAQEGERAEEWEEEHQAA